MKLDEFCEEIGRSPNTVLKNWKRTQESLEKKGILVKRAGTGKSAQYFVEYQPK